MTDAWQPSGYVVVMNAQAGSTDQEATDACIAVLASHRPTELHQSSGSDELGTVLDLVGDRVVVAAGGDGSLHAVVQQLYRRGALATTAVGLIPLGTGNDFARGTGLPLDPVAAAQRMAAGAPRPYDLIVDERDGVVVNAAHVGLGAAAAEHGAGLKDRLGAIAYPLGAMLAAARSDGWALRVDVDGKDLPLPGGQNVLMAGVGNGPTIGGGTPLFPGARADDGVLDVVVSCATGLAARVAFGAALREGRHLQRDDVVAVQGHEVRISGEAAGYDSDGELEADVTDRSYRIEPGAWRLVS